MSDSKGGSPLASDLGDRLMELHALLGESPQAFAARFGRGRKQFYKWRKGDQLPARSAVERAAETNGWPMKIFEDGGPRPTLDTVPIRQLFRKRMEMADGARAFGLMLDYESAAPQAMYAEVSNVIDELAALGMKVDALLQKLQKVRDLMRMLSGVELVAMEKKSRPQRFHPVPGQTPATSPVEVVPESVLESERTLKEARAKKAGQSGRKRKRRAG